MGSRSRAEVHSTPLSLSLSPERHHGALLLGKLRDVTILVREFWFCNDSTSKMWQTKMKIESGIVGKQDK